ncbi:MAG: outer membrane protein transport protein [Verrucomicrobiae bacterium]|nr:outer membrane protein transport protein [Verrucomicrobiae bacterium]
MNQGPYLPRRDPSRFHPLALMAILFSIHASVSVAGNGINRGGVGPRSMAMGGATIADRSDAFGSMATNPANLTLLENGELEVSATGVLASGSFTAPNGISGGLDQNSGAFGEMVLRIPLTSRIGAGLSIIPDSTRIGDWDFRDPQGGVDGDTSYGQREHRSSIIAVRAALGFGFVVTDRLSAGVSIGGTYNRNELRSPYVFQNHPILTGFKTLLELEADGWGINSDVGLTYKINEHLDLALSYRSPTSITTKGGASGNIGKQLQNVGLGGARPDFHYDAEVDNTLPQSVSTGILWKISAETRLGAQVDWINWASSFDTLDIRLRNGNNADINGVLESSGIDDYYPLEWEDRFVFRIGMEHDISDRWSLRAGYTYGRNPIPNATLLPTTGGISEHAISLGVGYHHGPFEINLGYQYDLPAAESVGASSLAAGELDNSKVEVQAHWIALSVGYEF